MPVLTQIAEDARLLTLLLETLEGALEILVLVDDDFGQTGSLPDTGTAEALANGILVPAAGANHVKNETAMNLNQSLAEWSSQQESQKVQLPYRISLN